MASANSGRSRLAIPGRAPPYDALKIEREETRAGARVRSNIDYYAPTLKLIIAKEYAERDGRKTLIKFDKIYASPPR